MGPKGRRAPVRPPLPRYWQCPSFMPPAIGAFAP